MGLKLNRKKNKSYLLSFIYRTMKILPISAKTKLKISLNLEWIFDRLSHEYSFKNYNPNDHPIRVNTIKFLSNFLDKTTSVLDLGCHYGELTFLVSKISYRTIGVDYNEEWINKAKEKFGNNDNLNFYHSEAHEYLSKNKDSFDVLILSHILEHLDNPKEFLLKFKSFFRNIYIEVPDFDKSFLNHYRENLNLSLIYMDEDHISEFDRVELSELLTSCNLTIVEKEFKHGVQRIWCKVNI